MTTRRRLAFVALALTAASVATAASCTTFNFPYPADAAADACGADTATGGGYLSVSDAVRVCSLVATCPGMDLSISASIALPLDLTGGSLAMCVDWLAGSTSANHLGFAIQESMLRCMANATTCDAALACAFIRPIDAGSGLCVEGCLDGGILRCVGGIPLESPCGPPIWGDGGTCVEDTVLSVKVPYCGTVEPCARTLGTACANETTEYVCNQQDAGNYWTVDCNVFGEVCANTACDSPLGGAVCSASDPVLSCTGDSRAIRYCNRQPQIHSTFDCSQSGRACVLTGAGLPYCRGPCDTCAPYDPGMGHCATQEGTLGISLCVDGVSSFYPCTCVSDPNGGHCQ